MNTILEKFMEYYTHQIGIIMNIGLADLHVYCWYQFHESTRWNCALCININCLPSLFKIIVLILIL